LAVANNDQPQLAAKKQESLGNSQSNVLPFVVQIQPAYHAEKKCIRQANGSAEPGSIMAWHRSEQSGWGPQNRRPLQTIARDFSRSVLGYAQQSVETPEKAGHEEVSHPTHLGAYRTWWLAQVKETPHSGSGAAKFGSVDYGLATLDRWQVDNYRRGQKPLNESRQLASSPGAENRMQIADGSSIEWSLTGVHLYRRGKNFAELT
jgi:hypothetical protein